MENNLISEGKLFCIDIETLFNIASILQLYMHVFESYLIDENDPRYDALREFVLEALGKFGCKIKEVGIKLEKLENKLASGTDCANLKADLEQIRNKIDKEVNPEVQNTLSLQISQVNSRIDELEMVLGNPRKRKLIDDEVIEEEEREVKVATAVEELNENIRRGGVQEHRKELP